MVIGGGFAGLAAVRRLCRSGRGLDVTLVDRRADHHFLPVLPDLIGRDLPLKYVVCPLERYGARWGCRVLREQVTSVDLDGRTADTAAQRLPFDFLVMASGSETDFHGREDLPNCALTLHSAEDVMAIRGAVAGNRYENFVVAGGGYTGVEAATNIVRACRRLGRAGRIVIVEAAAALCSTLPGPLQAYIDMNVRGLGIETRFGTTVAEAGSEAVCLSNGESIPRALLVWTAGVRTGDMVQGLDHRKTAQGRLAVDECLRLREHCFAAGDAAGFSRSGRLLRMGVQFSISEGHCAAGNVLRAIAGRPPRRFRPFDPGYLVPMANNRACGVVMGVTMRGRLPSLLHYAMCVLRSRGAANRWGLLRALVADGLARRRAGTTGRANPVS